MMKNFYLLFLIIPIILAGCAQKATEAVKGGLEVTKFAPDLSKIGSKQQIGITLLVKNNGESQATNVIAVLGGLPISANDWQVLDKDGSIKREAEPRNLTGADLQIGFKGEDGVVTWKLSSPEQKTDQTYDITASVYYGYTTSSTALFKLVSLNYYQTLSEEQQKAVEKELGIISVKTTSGPLSVSMKTQQTIISGMVKLPVEIKFTNTGGGRVFKEGDVLDQTTKAGLDMILVEPSKNVECKGTQEDNKYLVRLSKGTTGRLLCYVPTTGKEVFETATVDVKASYRYFIESKTSITVLKTIEVPLATTTKVADPNYCETKIKNYRGECTYAEGGCNSDAECAKITIPYRLSCVNIGTGVKACCYIDSQGNVIDSEDCKIEFLRKNK